MAISAAAAVELHAIERTFRPAEGRPFEYRLALEEFGFQREGKPGAVIRVLSYRAIDRAERALTFVFNGGPGSSAIWLHMGLLGPRRVAVGAEPMDDGAAPYPVADNPQSLLAVSDLVFVDPVGTGFSRALGETEPAAYWGVDEDAAATAALIRRYLSVHRRWMSPKYLIGESYGTYRIAATLSRLQDDFQGTSINGVVLISPALMPSTYVFAQGNDLAHVLFLPTYVAVAHFHGLLAPELGDLEELLLRARRFARDEYLPALHAGFALEGERRHAVAGELARLTGIDRDYWLGSNLRVSSSRFMKELLRERGLAIGRLDGRYTVTERDRVGEFVATDPARNAVDSAFLAGLWSEVLGPLGVDPEREYEVLNFRANRRWSRPEDDRSIFAGFLNAIPELEAAAANNRDLRVFAVSGIHDLTTSFYGSEYQLAQAGIDPKRVWIRNYPGGHMMYLDPTAFAAISADLIEFARDAARR